LVSGIISPEKILISDQSDIATQLDNKVLSWLTDIESIVMFAIVLFKLDKWYESMAIIMQLKNKSLFLGELG